MENLIPSRKEMIQSLKEDFFDIIIVGGGITGAGVARDASLRGLKIALLEKQDFASGTSSMTSKMIHGGLRYLKNYEFRLVRQAALERKVHLEIAPHLAELMQFIVPIYDWSPENKWKLRLGLFLYDLLAFPKGIGRHKSISKEDAVEKLALLENDDLKTAFLYNDVKTDDARLTLSNVLSAAATRNASIANYTEVISWKKTDVGVSVKVKNKENNEEFTIKGETIILCGGPWTEQLEERAENYEGKAKLRTTWGSHLRLKKKLKDDPVLIINEDGRPVYLIPRIDYDLAGTTDIDYDGDPDEITPTKSDMKYILEACNKLFPKANYTKEDVVAMYTGLRPLVYEKGVDESEVSRDHKIYTDNEKVLTMVGGKLTTYRVMAREAIDKTLELLNLKKKHYRCVTHNLPIWGGVMDEWEEFKQKEMESIMDQYDLDEHTSAIMVQWYGSELPFFKTILDKHGTAKLKESRPWLEAQVIYSCKVEMIRNPVDFLRRRTPIMLEQGNGEEILGRVVELMAEELDWDKNKADAMKAKTRTYINKFIRP